MHKWNGVGPRAGLGQTLAGNFYGTTHSGSRYNFGAVFALTTHGTLATRPWFDSTYGAFPKTGWTKAADGN